MNLRQLAMHQRGRADHAPAIDLADRLMAEANAEDRHDRPGARDELEADAGAVRIARSRREHDRFRALGQNLVDRHLVVAVDAGGCAQFAEEMNEIVGEAVVVIDQREHESGVTLGTPAPSRIEPLGKIGASSFETDLRYSSAWARRPHAEERAPA